MNKKEEKNFYKTKEELDLFTYDKVMNVRWDILRKGENFNKEDKRYITELEFYTRLRFEEKEKERFKKWEEASKNTNQSDINKLAEKMLVDIGYEQLKYMNMAHDLYVLGEFKYIIGIEYPALPEQWKNATFNLEKL